MWSFTPSLSFCTRLFQWAHPLLHAVLMALLFQRPVTVISPALDETFKQCCKSCKTGNAVGWEIDTLLEEDGITVWKRSWVSHTRGYIYSINYHLYYYKYFNQRDQPNPHFLIHLCALASNFSEEMFLGETKGCGLSLLCRETSHPLWYLPRWENVV